MATFAQAPPRRRARLLLRLLAIVLAVLVLAAGGAALWFYSAARSSLPQLDGTVPLPGLSAPATVVRDEHGVPHITAANMEDLAFAQGYVTAQDRLWEMDISRRYAAGELAEIFGPEYLKSDRLQRILGMRQVAQRAAGVVTGEDRRLLEAYSRGVNAYIASHHGSLPLEFRVLRYAPRPWSPQDSFLVACMFNEMLNLYSAYHMLAREQVSARLPAEMAVDLFPNQSWRDHPPGVDGRASSADEQTTGGRRPASAKPAGMAARWPKRGQGEGLVPGSNNWVVSGAHTVSGKPLLSNDMHLPHRIPNVWYELHLTSRGFDVAGVSAPGLPLVVVGHNRRIAWGFTNLGPSVTDLYVETFNSAGQYQTPEGWKAPEHRHELIPVKGRREVAVNVIITRHGPIVTGVLPGEKRALALQWTLWDPKLLSSSLEAFRGLDEASTWEEFRRAAARFGGPGQNLVYADVDGHIGYQATGWVPLRKAGDASRPVPGNVDTYNWAGYVPFENMPSVFDPPGGIIATANGRVTPDGYPYLISAEWAEPYRTQRIYQVLESGKKFSSAEMLALQSDIESDIDRFFARQFVSAVDRAPTATPRVRQAADLMRNWDGRVTVEAVAPTIVLAARRELERLLLEPWLGPAGDKSKTGWREYAWENSEVWLETVLADRPKRWLPKAYPSWDDLLTAAVEQAVTANPAPRDLASWHWGQAHPISLQHPVFGRMPLLRHWTGTGAWPQSGDRNTVKQVDEGFGPSERMTVDFADWDASTLNLVTGESGNFLSPYYMDQWRAWYGGTSFRLPFSRAAIEKARRHELRLEPR